MSTQDFPRDDEGTHPFEIDTAVAHPARRYDYWLGGTANFEADRISADAWEAAFPTIRIGVQENRRFLRRAVTYLVKEAGIRQFLDIGTGIPAAGNVHEVAQALAPESRVVYVDNDPVVLAHAQLLLAGSTSGTIAYIQADLRHSETIFGDVDLRETLDLSRPVALMLIAVVHFLTDEEAYGRVTALTSGLPPGSYLAMSHGTLDFVRPEAAQRADVVIRGDGARSRDQFQPRDRAGFARFFRGMTVVPPGIQSIYDWHVDGSLEERTSPADISSYGAVARIS